MDLESELSKSEEVNDDDEDDSFGDYYNTHNKVRAYQ